MFTGIVKSVGSVKTLEEDHLLISTDDDNFNNLETGTSISIDGCCLTQENILTRTYYFKYLMRQYQEHLLIKITADM